MRIVNSIPILVLIAKQTLGDDINRGVPHSRRLQSDVKTFLCDGSLQIGIDKVNDDYCDCTDGTDEPGTSACSHLFSRFFCVNENHKEMFIHTSRVDDGHCDCCDGSDESSGLCENTCRRDAEAYRIAHLEELKRFEEGAEKKMDLLERAKSKRIEIEKRIEEITETLNSLNAEIEDLQKEELRVEKEHTDTKQKRNEETEARILRGLGLTDFSHEDLLNIIFELSQVSEQYIDIIREQAMGAKKNEAEEEEEKEEVEEKNSEEVELNVQIARALQENNVDSAARILSVNKMSEKEIRSLVFRLAALNDGWAEQIKRTSVEEKMDETGNNDGESSWFGRIFVSNEESDEDEKDENERSLSKSIEMMLNTMNDSYQPKSVIVVKDKIRELTKKKTRTENEKKSVSEKLQSLSWGSDSAWLALMDECFEKEVGEFTYKICIGGEAKQGSTKLGKFEKWEGDTFETMVYENGAKCWKGPKRSIHVKVRCGPETKLLSVEEPSMCVYVSELETPAACVSQSSTEPHKEL